MSTATFVMAVPFDPKRARNAVALARETGAEVVWDRTFSIMDTWRSLLHRIGSDPAIVLEDDVVLARDWRARVEEAIAEHPDAVIQFFSRFAPNPGWRRPLTYEMNQCHYLPAGAAVSLLAYAEGWEERPAEFDYQSTACDRIIGYWLRDRGQRYWQVTPSLVQHLEWESVVDAHRSTRRRSRTFQG